MMSGRAVNGIDSRLCLWYSVILRVFCLTVNVENEA